MGKVRRRLCAGSSGRQLTQRMKADAAREWSFQPPVFMMGGDGVGSDRKPPECGRVCPFDGRLLGKSIRRWGSGGCGRAGLTPPWEPAAGRPGRLGKWAKWSDWFPEPGSESTRAGRHWWGEDCAPPVALAKPSWDALFSTLEGDPAGWGWEGQQASGWGNPVSGVNQQSGSSSPLRCPAPSAAVPTLAKSTWRSELPVHSEPGL